MLYKLYQKSHCEACDLDVEVEADNMQEAIKKFENIVKGDVDESDVRQVTAMCWNCKREEEIVNMRSLLTQLEGIVYICPFCEDRFSDADSM
jgi:hypothetical protein